jgi:hemerythrin-like domain-containing protein
MTAPPDVFSNVHKGIRSALFDLCLRIGRTDHSQRDRWAELTRRVTDTLSFIDRHGENEDLLLLPLMQERAPMYFERMRSAHRKLDDTTEAVRHAMIEEPAKLYHAACAFTAEYLEHMAEEELVHLPVLHIHLSTDELHEFERKAIARTAPTEQNLLLGYMLSAMTDSEVTAFLAKTAADAPEEVRDRIQKAAAVSRRGH